MSDLSIASEDSLPVSPVRPPEAALPTNHVLRATSPSKPKAITSANSVEKNGSKDFSFPTVGVARVNGHQCIAVDGDGGSDPTTPRLPPARNGSNDLDNISHEAITALNQLDGQSSTSPISSTEHFLRPLQLLSSTFSSSVSEPGSGVWEYQQIHSLRPPQLARLHDESTITSWLKGFQQPDTVPFTKSTTIPHTPCKNHQRIPPGSRMSASRGQGEVNNGDLSTREEAFPGERNRSSSRSSQSRVEKRIEATLADAEPSSHARSRKSSHTLGLFKETTNYPANQRGQRRQHPTPDNAIDYSPDSGTLQDQEVAEHDNQSRADSLKANAEDGKAQEPLLGKQELRDGSAELKCSSQGLRQSSRPPSYDLESAKSSSKDGAERDSSATNDSKQENCDSFQATSDTSKNSVPPRLLEEIRNFHNLAAPFHDKFRSDEHKVSTPNVINKDSSRLTPAQKTGLTERNAPDVKIDPKVPVELDNDDEESISSILYNPHQAPSPDALEDVSIEEARKLKEESVELEARLPEPVISPGDENDRSEDVGIALQVHNRNRYFHGDLSKAQPSSIELENKRVFEGGFSSASESDYESQDENKPLGSQEEYSLTDDAELTPRASPNTRKSYLKSRPRKAHRIPAAPLGAVELKPYNHQVGGHTNLFRFSKRAVCKQLSNRENEFYEVVERQHPELLKFLPKYVPFEPSCDLTLLSNANAPFPFQVSRTPDADCS